MKKYCAVFKHVPFGSLSFLETDTDGNCWADDHEDYVRLTHSAEVIFVKLSSEERATKELSALDKEEYELRIQLAEFADALSAIEVKRAELLALPASV